MALQAYWHVLWSAARSVHVRTWDEKQAQHWDSAIKGSSASKAGLLRRLAEEIAVLEGDESMTTYWDVEKLYDSIAVDKLVVFAMKRGFSPFIAAIYLQVHIGIRRLRWAGCY